MVLSSVLLPNRELPALWPTLPDQFGQRSIAVALCGDRKPGSKREQTVVHHHAPAFAETRPATSAVPAHVPRSPLVDRYRSAGMGLAGMAFDRLRCEPLLSSA